jgi:hypothetical protein
MTRARQTTNTQVETGYAPVNCLEMYYEIHGTGEPLLMLHEQCASIGMFSHQPSVVTRAAAA